MGFQYAFDHWIEKHIGLRKGENKRRLAQGLGHAEKLFLKQVWYPAFRQFDGLHPEYEVADFRDGSRFLDFAYFRFPLKLAIEIDGYGPHATHSSRWHFADSLMRQNHLVIDGWRVLRFAYDDVSDKPRMCEQVIQQFVGSWIGSNSPAKPAGAADIIETEVLRLAIRLERYLRPSDVCQLLQIRHDKARSILHSMVKKQTLLPAGKGTQRIRCFKVNREHMNDRTWC
ncbi:endonuclease domain-containing protein [Paenibacillus oenotherae]|uniref:Endonuclease domain-containing protein n=1 Tax=Paenibacillus oenotherae TaxID=1435645 RepID=A0ABS7D3S7_9BACL|nr:endonuclease domain-containing protein [Paenibacillus oenotherae]MBW7474589.1 endonuclease domain-containing protein [Paenibacillus oenotherae]